MGSIWVLFYRFSAHFFSLMLINDSLSFKGRNFRIAVTQQLAEDYLCVLAQGGSTTPYLLRSSAQFGDKAEALNFLAQGLVMVFYEVPAALPVGIVVDFFGGLGDAARHFKFVQVLVALLGCTGFDPLVGFLPQLLTKR